MNDEERKQELAEEYSAGPELSQFYAAWNKSRMTPQPSPPYEIIEAARRIENWMTKNGHKNWQLLGVCDRNYAYQLEQIRKVLLT